MIAEITKAAPLIRSMISDFRNRWGVEPAGILMSPWTLIRLRESSKIYDTDKPSFQGIKIYTSEDIETGEIRFIL